MREENTKLLQKLKRDIELESMEKMLSSFEDLTLAFSDAIAYGPLSETKVFSHKTGVPYRRETTAFISNIHALTHMDLPWALSESEWSYVTDKVSKETGIKIPPSPGTPGGESLLKKYSSARFLKCIIVDISSKRKDLFNYTHESKPLDIVTGHAKETFSLGYEGEIFQSEVIQFKTRKEFKELIEGLCITKEELQKSIEPLRKQIKDFSETIICFRTYWNVFFRPQYPDIRHPLWNCYHPYLLHPYLDEFGVDYLLKELNIAGVAADIPGLDCPLYDVLEVWSFPLIGEVKKEILQGDSRIKLSDARFRAVQFSVLALGKYYIKNLNYKNPIASGDDFNSFFHSGEIHTGLGNLLLLPIYVDHNKRDAILLKVLLLKEPRE